MTLRSLFFCSLCVVVAASPASAKETRDERFAAGGFVGPFEVVESENFALRWTSSAVDLDADAAALLLQDLEDAFVRFHVEVGHRLPVGADRFRLNAYVATPTTVPDMPGYGAYASFDDDGIPYMVISDEMVRARDPGTRFVVAHEYFHAVQFATGAYSAPPSSGDPVGWYFEATANWAATTVWPDDDALYGDLGRYLASTERPLFLASSVLGDDDPALAHDYGAFLFPLYLEQWHGGADVIRDSWDLAGADDDPIDVVAGLVGVDAGDLFADFAAKNAVFDYPSATRAKIDAWLPVFAADPQQPSLVVGRVAADKAFESAADDERALHAFGYHVVEVVGAGHLVVTADDGDLAALRATLTLDTSPPTFVPLIADEDGLVVDVDAHAARAFLTVAAVNDTRDVDVTVGYRAAFVDAVAGESDDESDDVAGGCAAADAPSGVVGLALLGLRRLRRRR